MAEQQEYSMMPHDRRVEVKRISWGAIIAGVLIVIMIQITLALLGIAIGFSTINPMTQEEPAYGVMTGGLIWWGISGLISLFVGGWAASRFSGKRTGVLHGITVWALVQIILIYLLTSAVGTLLGGAFSIIQSSLTAAAKAIPAVAEKAWPDDANVDVSWKQIKTEIKQILRQTEDPDLKPENLEAEAQEMKKTPGEAAAKALKTPSQAEKEISDAVDKMLSRADDVISDVDKDAVVNVLVNRTDMTEREARKTVDRWVDFYQQNIQEVKETAREFKEGAVETAEQIGQTAAETISASAWASFFMLLLGATAAAVGGALGIRFPEDRRHRVH